jgi:cytochrome c peroxidase
MERARMIAALRAFGSSVAIGRDLIASAALDCIVRRKQSNGTPRSTCGAIVLGVSIVAAPIYADDTTQKITTPRDARRLGLQSLRLAVRADGGVPQPTNLSEFVKDRAAAVRLGQALFWDMQVGSDGVQACASCHFHAGADDRATNAVNPDQGVLDQRTDDVQGYMNAGFDEAAVFEIRQPNETLTRADFPFVKSIQQLVLTSDGRVQPAPGNSNDIAGSMGIAFTRFEGIQAGIATDLGTALSDPVFSANGATVRAVEHRNTPSVINAVFNFANFWDGRANPRFNGRNSFGNQDSAAVVFVNDPATGVSTKAISMDNASLASQAVAPAVNQIEMSFGDAVHGNGRRVRELGMKLLRASSQTGRPLVPLGAQRVHPLDSVLGRVSKWPRRGLATSYEAMIKQAFVDKYWNSDQPLRLASTPAATDFTQMEANFSLFFGLAIQLYEATLVADRSGFDRWMESGNFNPAFGWKELAGLNVFVNQGECVQCHAGPELCKASVRSARQGTDVIRAMPVAHGAALYDNGYYNLGVTPTTDDLGRGDVDSFGQPLAFARQALVQRLGIFEMDFDIFGNDHIAARAEELGTPVCADANGNGRCESTETIHPAFHRTAVDGAFKTPGLRNVELTGPYFHNGGMATLRQVVQFYNRGGNFCSFNQRDLAPRIKPLGLSPMQEQSLVAFLVSLTDTRVKYRQAPFDHPELRVPKDGLDAIGARTLPPVGAFGAPQPLTPFLQLSPQDAIFVPSGVCSTSAR